MFGTILLKKQKKQKNWKKKSKMKKNQKKKKMKLDMSIHFCVIMMEELKNLWKFLMIFIKMH